MFDEMAAEIERLRIEVIKLRAELNGHRAEWHAPKILGLTVAEGRILQALIERPDYYVKQSDILKRCWPVPSPPDVRIVHTLASRLRKKLAAQDVGFDTAYKVGYRIRSDVAAKIERMRDASLQMDLLL